MNFSKFSPRSLSTRDGFLTIPNDDLAGFTLCTCVFALIFVPFDPFMVGRKVPFFVPLQCALYIGGLYRAIWVNFSKVFFPFPLLSGWIPSPLGGEAAPSNSGTCILTLIFTPFGPFMKRIKMPFLVP